jgi:hypothetical protein
LLAEERGIPEADIHKLMYKKPSTHSVIVFCRKHDVSYDWLLCGDLRGLRAMEQKRRAALQADAETLTKEFRRLMQGIGPADYPALLAKMREIVGTS